MFESAPRSRFLFWLNQAPWRILPTGVVLALTLAALLMWQLMQAPSREIAALVSTLAMTSLLSLGIGYLLYRRGWARFSSLTLTLIMTYLWAAMLTLFNVWILAQQMFASEHDLLLSGVLLLFAVIIATSFGIFVAATVTDGLRQLAHTAQQLAAGDLTARVAVSGRDEVAQVAESFNEMAAQLQQAARQREELDRLRRDLIAWTSHDLRTPLTSIRAMVEALHDGVVTDPVTVQRYYHTIRSDVIALNVLIDDLFELAQLDTGGLVIEKSVHDLGDLLSDALESFRALAQQRGITVDGYVAADVRPLPLNAAKISRVLANLLSNALRYTPAQGHVQVRVARSGVGVQVTVQDSGPGFNEDDLPRVFEQFYRGEQARSRATGGAGLGLAIARGIVEAHHGRIWAENAAGGGAVVGFELPLTQ
ncbi:MAG: HAMP domain-containing protein [Anaerolinea sp.]|nr:HAMP domain-containing protein [Anaerolinea sp.]